VRSDIDTPALEKIFEKIFQKPLDKIKKIWYNIYVIKRGNPLKIKK
jgi:hypothetical protein